MTTSLYLWSQRVRRKQLQVDNVWNGAKEAYSTYKILGSDDKDIVDDRRIHQLWSSCFPRGQCYTGCAHGGLSAITFEAVQLGATTDQLHLSLVGGWTSTLLFRRPFMGLLNRAFNFVDLNGFPC